MTNFETWLNERGGWVRFTMNYATMRFVAAPIPAKLSTLGNLEHFYVPENDPAIEKIAAGQYVPMEERENFICVGFTERGNLPRPQLQGCGKVAMDAMKEFNSTQLKRRFPPINPLVKIWKKPEGWPKFYRWEKLEEEAK